jgi:hypothetical protein
MTAVVLASCSLTSGTHCTAAATGLRTTTAAASSAFGRTSAIVSAPLSVNLAWRPKPRRGRTY